MNHTSHLRDAGLRGIDFVDELTETELIQLMEEAWAPPQCNVCARVSKIQYNEVWNQAQCVNIRWISFVESKCGCIVCIQSLYVQSHASRFGRERNRSRRCRDVGI